METIEHVHRNIPGNGTVTIKVERNSKGHNWEIRIERPILDHSLPFEVGAAIAADIDEIERELKARFESNGQDQVNRTEPTEEKVR